jgi:hypothetical protein
MNTRKPKKTRFLNPPNYLKQKVGSGGLPEKVLLQADKIMEQNNLDFSVYVKKFLDHIDVTVSQALKSEFRTHEHVLSIVYPVMQLKAHGGMFGYQLISEISANLLMFLENIHVLDDDAAEIVRVHYNTLLMLSNNDIRGLGGAEGYNLLSELQGVCDRYYKKHNIELD